nr:UPF0158 family protein [Candidatus Sigynarchaeota archaeon]
MQPATRGTREIMNAARKSQVTLTRAQLGDIALWMHDTSDLFYCYLDVKTGDVKLVSRDVNKLEDWDENQDKRLVKLLTGVPYEDLKENYDEWQSIEKLVDIKYIRIPQVEPWEPYEDMKAFIATVTHVPTRERLSIAIQGKGAFRKFKDVMNGNPGLDERWYEFKSTRENARVVEWLESRGYSVKEVEDD